jgi:GcrA cell cycle regulator
MHSEQQIGERLGRSRSAIAGKISRLRRVGVIKKSSRKAGGAVKKFAVNPRVGQVRKKLDNVSKNSILAAITPPPPLKFHRVNAPLDPHPCTLIELDAGQCHWPLGDLLDPPRLFCGAPSLDGLPYCDHHAQLAYQKEPHHGRSHP